MNKDQNNKDQNKETSMNANMNKDPKKENVMNKDQLIGNWEQFKGTVRKQWGKLTDDQVAQIKGDRQVLAGKIQEAYGVAKEEAETQIKKWEDACRRDNAA